jgi:hypothetical protein
MAQSLMVESKSASELSALSAYDLGLALNEILEAVEICRKLQRSVRDRIASAKIECLRATTADELIDAKERRILAEAEFQHIRDRASTLRLQSSILQSLLRAANIT